MRLILCAVMALPLLTFTRPAAANQAQDFINVGALFGFTSDLDGAFYSALGAEGTFTHYTDRSLTWGLGAFTQVQAVDLDHVRVALGPQVNFMVFGLELGPYVEQGAGSFATTVGLQASPFVSFAYASAAMRIGVPLGAVSSGDRYPLDLGLMVTLKWVFPIGGKLFALSF
jgi:hypothetical protein